MSVRVSLVQPKGEDVVALLSRQKTSHFKTKVTAHPGALPRSDPKATPTLLTSLFMLYRAVVYTKEAISIFLVKNKYFRFLCGPRQKEFLQITWSTYTRILSHHDRMAP